jgi:hypothetical protein
MRRSSRGEDYVVDAMSETERKVVVDPGRIVVIEPELCAEFEVYGEAPVQGFGTVLGVVSTFVTGPDCL